MQLSFDRVDPMWPDALLDRHSNSTMLGIVDPAAAAAQVPTHGLADRPGLSRLPGNRMLARVDGSILAPGGLKRRRRSVPSCAPAACAGW